MKPGQKVVVIYALSTGAAYGVAYFRGKRGFELVKDTACYGLAGGTVANVVAYIAVAAAKPKIEIEAKQNFNPLRIAAKNTMGKLSKGGLQLLSNLDTEKLYAAMKSGGVKVAPLPDNPSIVVQDET